MDKHCKKDVIRSYFTLKVYKLYQSAMPFTVKVKNIFLIRRNLIFLKINILTKLYTAVEVSGERKGELAPRECKPFTAFFPSFCLFSVTATQQTEMLTVLA